MSLIGKEIAGFSVQAYQNNEFRTVTKDDVLGKWSLFFSTPLTSPLCAPRSLRTWRTSTRNSPPPVARCIRFHGSTHFPPTRPGMRPL